MNYITLMIGALVSISAHALDRASCDSLYAQRFSSLASVSLAVDCYQALGVDDQAAEAIAWGSLNSKDRSDKKKFNHLGLLHAEKMKSANAGSATYWKAVFVTFDCQERDGGSVIPMCMFKQLGEIQSLLLDAIKRSPKTNFFGPDRTYGIMYLQMPAMVGGDKAIAEKHLRLAYDGAPTFSLNALMFGKALIKTKQKSEAKQVLEKLLNLTESQVPTNYWMETQVDQSEARKLLQDL